MHTHANSPADFRWVTALMHGARSSSHVIFSRTFAVATDSTFQNPPQKKTSHTDSIQLSSINVLENSNLPDTCLDPQAPIEEFRPHLCSSTASPGLIVGFGDIIILYCTYHVVNIIGCRWDSLKRPSFGRVFFSSIRSSMVITSHGLRPAKYIL